MDPHEATPAAARRAPVLVGIAVVVLALLGAGALLYRHAQGDTNTVALADAPKPVTTVEARGTSWRPQRRYVGTLEAWQQARIGPQLVSAYVQSIEVRPGAIVRQGQVLATLDCRSMSTVSKAVEQQAKALAATQAAVAKEAERVSGLLQGGFASANEVEQKQAESTSKQAQLLALQAQVAGTSLQVADCVLRAPFDGEISDRQADPGTFVRPGSAIATLLDRRTVRVVADVPEDDFEAIAPGTSVQLHVLATGADLTGTISRRAPAADPSTRTVRLEIDLPNPHHALPVGTTAELVLDVGTEVQATEVPLTAASVKGGKANLFVVESGVAHQRSVAVRGERAGRLFVDAALPPGSHVVTEGRGQLLEGDEVQAKELVAEPVAPALEHAVVAAPRTKSAAQKGNP